MAEAQIDETYECWYLLLANGKKEFMGRGHYGEKEAYRQAQRIARNAESEKRAKHNKPPWNYSQTCMPIEIHSEMVTTFKPKKHSRKKRKTVTEPDEPYRGGMTYTGSHAGCYD